MNIPPGILAAGFALLSGIAGAQGGDPNVRHAGGMDIYFGVMAAETVQHRGAGHVEMTMHAKAELQPYAKHVMIALFDSASGARISDARVLLKVAGGPAVVLEPMPINGAMSYGNYMALPDRGANDVRVEIVRPGAHRAAVATFTYPLAAP